MIVRDEIRETLEHKRLLIADGTSKLDLRACFCSSSVCVLSIRRADNKGKDLFIYLSVEDCEALAGSLRVLVKNYENMQNAPLAGGEYE
jgi:hypothetical protein